MTVVLTKKLEGDDTCCIVIIKILGKCNGKKPSENTKVKDLIFHSHLKTQILGGIMLGIVSEI